MSWRAVPTSAAVATLLLLVPATAWSAVPRTGNTFAPRNGAELLEAADAISSEGRTNAAFRGVIELQDAEYAVSRTVVLTSLYPAALVRPASGRARITNSGAPITLLRYSSQQAVPADAGVRGVDFTLKGTTANTVIAVDLQRGSAVRDSSISVPTAGSKATAVRLSPSQGTATPASSAVIERVDVVSGTADAPAVRVSNGGQILDSTVTGGAPPVEIIGDASGSDLGHAVVDASTVRTQGTTAAVPAIRVRGGGNSLRAVVWSTVVDGTAGASPLIDVAGPTATTGALQADIGQVSLRGAQSSIGVRVRPGVGTSPLRVDVRGLLSLGSPLAVDCMGSANARSTVTVTGVYRSGSNNQGTSCDFVESGLRTGALVWRDEASGDLRPVWNSPLVDAVQEGVVPPPAAQHDRSGGQRFVSVRSSATPGDIGALEYQLTPPQNVVAEYVTLGNRGLTALVGEGFDPDEQEQAKLTYRWTLPDGTTFDRPVELVRFSSSAPQQVKLAVIDVTGVTVFRTITVQPNVRLDQPPTDSNDPEDPGTLPEPGQPQPSDPAPEALFPQSSGGGSGAPTTSSGIDPSLKQDYPPILKQVRATKRRVLTSRRQQPEYATARRGEAEIIIETWRKSEMALEVTPILEGTGMAAGLPLASVPLKPFKGRKTLRVGGKVGKKKLRPGLYEMAISATPRPGAVPERARFYVRVIRG